MRRSRLALAGSIVLILAGCGSSGTPPPALTPSAAAPTAQAQLSPSTSPSTAPASPTPSSLASGWQHVPDQPAFGQTQLALVVWTGQRFIAAGSLDDGSAAIFDSNDGQAWHLGPNFGTDVQIHGLAATPAGVVAVGAKGSDGQSWVSTDGLSWTAGAPVPAVHPGAGGLVRMNMATSTGTGWLAVGEEDVACQLDCNSSAAVRAAAWISGDGRTWTRQPDSVALGHAAMIGVVRGGPGYVAVGIAPDQPASVAGPEHAVVWTSTDGHAWSRVPDAATFHAPKGTDQTFGDMMSGIAADGTQLVAVGLVESQDAGSALAWRSVDGRTWTRATGDRFPYGQLFGVAAVPDGFLATGPSGPDSCLGGIWSSADGGSWSCVAVDPTFAGFAAYAAAASPQVEVVVGLDTSTGSTSVWTRATP